jgi:predicted butyrate kinase (DUF1464 family)
LLSQQGGGDGWVMLNNFTDAGAKLLIEYIKGLEERPKIFTPGLILTYNRVQEWRKKGVIDFAGPCFSAEIPCYTEAQKRVVELEHEDQD